MPLSPAFSDTSARIVVVNLAFIAYVDSDEFGSGTFGSFLCRWMAAHSVTDLFTVSGCAKARAPSIKRNEQFIATQRSRMREQLHSAACAGQLVWHDGPMVDLFVPEGITAATTAELEELED